ncbi:MAG: glutamate synthase large subunit [Gammaproteobacteria bacterium]|nr:glutamate synthase large subunit [Gammaproteobacteria bacterium]
MRLDTKIGFPEPVGLYDPNQEKDSCGVGFVAHVKGLASHQIMLDAYMVNSRMDHRGGCGFEENTGDGAGILTAIPQAFFNDIAAGLGFSLPDPGQYAVGNIFLPTDGNQRSHCKHTIERLAGEEALTVLGWRTVPIEPEIADVGPAAIAAMPTIEQCFISQQQFSNEESFERALYVLRKRFTKLLRADQSLTQAQLVYACSLSPRVIVYKGMLTPSQLFPFYPDLLDERYTTHLAMVHSRFSTNTFPSWDRAQPNRFMSHNGEINTLMGNKNWMTARQGVVSSPVFGEDISKLFPVVEADCSDSGSFDNVLEFLLMSGRSLQEAVMMLIPEAWQSDANMNAEKRNFYEYHSALMEPWDGPASIAFTDGRYIGAVLDRNGLRPSRYYLTHDDKVIMASEVGVLPLEPASIKFKGRLQPGKMFLINFDQGRLIPDEELKQEYASQRPYGDWLKRQTLDIADFKPLNTPLSPSSIPLINRMKAFGYTTETLQFMLLPMVTDQRDPLGSMGNDSALACLSDKSRLLYDYFKQLFAQVTNPAIDSIREEVVMSLACFIGPEGNLLETSEQQAHRLRIEHPILTDEELSRLRQGSQRGWQSRTIDITYPMEDGEQGLIAALDRICAEATAAIEAGTALIILSDRQLDKTRLALSALMACGAVHHHLVASHQRTQIGILVETGEAREVHHFCLLTSYGADAINPYLAYEALWQAREDNILDSSIFPDMNSIIIQYKKAVSKGMLKVMGKMGISTLQSYKGAQIFEAIGLASDIVSRCFQGTASRVEGINFSVLYRESVLRHQLGFPTRAQDDSKTLPNSGIFHWRKDGDTHMWDPTSISNLQIASQNNDKAAYLAFSSHANEQATRKATLRGLLTFNQSLQTAISIDSVEPAKEIVKRFCTGAMSLGSISTESHEALAIAMNRMGGKSNTGEGGEDAVRFKVMENGDSKRSAIKQVASGRFGVTIWYLSNADELQIKIVQGAKPGEGGELPGGKVDSYIAKIRHSTPGVGLISPPPHHDIYSIEDIAQLIHDLKNANPQARISVKLGSEIGVGTIAAGVTKAKSDHLVIAGHDGGTGASPLTSIKHAGMPWELGLAETHQTLVINNLRSRVVLQTDGQLKTGRDVAIAALLGAEEFGFSTAPLITLGCVMMRKCHLNTCPVGIATQDLELRKKFSGKPDSVVNYLFMVAEELRQIMASLGFASVQEMVGQVQYLNVDSALAHWKADGLDLTSVLTKAPIIYEGSEIYQTREQNHGLDKALDNQLIKLAQPAILRGERVHIDLPIINTNRVVGTMLSHEVAKATEGELLPDDTIHIKLAGSAGQSLGAWLAKGITIEVEGDANDYVGKGLSGGRLIIYPPRESRFNAEDNVLLGNVVMYGATSGDAFFRGIAAERFCVRNSGASAVVEGIGDHGCEYMTGGTVIVLGPTGRNFGAGMSGGVAYIYDPEESFPKQCNSETFELESLTGTDQKTVKNLITRHLEYTGSSVAERILHNWASAVDHFVKVMPTDYKQVLMSAMEPSNDLANLDRQEP